MGLKYNRRRQSTAPVPGLAASAMPNPTRSILPSGFRQCRSLQPRLCTSPRRRTKLLTWGGLRGGLALALALSLPESHDKPLIVNMTFAVVAFSVLVQGSTIAKFFTPDYLKGLLK